MKELLKSEVKKIKKVANMLGLDTPEITAFSSGISENWRIEYTFEIQDFNTNKIVYIPFTVMIKDRRTSFVPNFIIGRNKKYSARKKKIVSFLD